MTEEQTTPNPDITDGANTPDQDIAQTLTEDPTVEAPSPLAEAQARIAEYDDRYKRLYSEFDNFRKRTARERLEMTATAGGEVIREILPAIDDLERGLKAYDMTTDAAQLSEGVRLVHKRLMAGMERKGLKGFVSIGEPFDTERHEAITQIPAPTEELKGKVVDEVEKGYLLGEKVLRFAKVVIGI